MKRGNIEVITGPMFSGKSTELIKRAKRLGLAGYKVQCFKPSIDTRYTHSHIASHDNMQHEAHPVSSLEELKAQLDPHAEVVAIDEIQFFSSDVVKLCEQLAEQDKHVIVSGLLLDCFGRPFQFTDAKKNMLHLMAVADTVDTLNAICTHKDYDGKICGRAGTRTQRFVDNKVAPFGELIVVGGQDSYAPRCRKHFCNYDEADDQ